MLLGPRANQLGERLGREHDVRSTLAPGASAVVVTQGVRFTLAMAKQVRVALRSRGVVLVACEAEQVVDVWLVLRRAGLEPKRAAFVHAPSSSVLVVARAAKRGGLLVSSLQGD